MKLKHARRSRPPLTKTGFGYIVPRKFHALQADGEDEGGKECHFNHVQDIGFRPVWAVRTHGSEERVKNHSDEFE